MNEVKVGKSWGRRQSAEGKDWKKHPITTRERKSTHEGPELSERWSVVCFVAPLNACVSSKLVLQNFLKVIHSN